MKAKQNNDFYKNLPLFTNLQDISTTAVYQKLPDSWFIVVADIKNSTQAIENGKYKDVNMAGALSIVALLNLDKNIDIPFVFGGDGAFLLIPPLLVDRSKQALLAVQKIVKDAYTLELRIGIIPVNDLKNNSKEILIAKLKISEHYSQAIIKGGGLEYCDFLLKTSNTYAIHDPIDPNFLLDIKGLSCRWESIPSPKEEVLSILIKSHDEKAYTNILMNIQRILGNSASRHPIVQENLILSYANKDLTKEVSLYTQNIFLQHLFLYKLKVINLLGDFLMKFKIGKWGQYKKHMITTTDTEKFDDMLRMTVSANYTQTQELEHYLEEETEKGTFVYGLHKADSSLMTCLIFDTHGKHIHFVDASKGGYAMAAKMLKQKL